MNKNTGLIPKHVMDAMLSGGNAFMAKAYDAATASSMAYLVGELEKRDPKVREPLTSITYPRDIVIKSGGGFVDWTSVMHVDYGTSGPNNFGIMGGASNAIPMMQADIGKDIYPVFPWMNALRIPWFDMQKAQQVGRSLDDLLNTGVKLNWNKALDLMTYMGFASGVGNNTGGLVNNTLITAVLAAAGASGKTTWANKTPQEIQADINYILNSTWAASQYDLTGMADSILVSPAAYGILTAPMTIAGCNSILEYVLANNVAKQQGREINILPSRWCIGAGEVVGGAATDRMVGYVNDEDRVYLDIPVPIMRAMTMPDAKDGAFYTLYAGQVGVVKFLYKEPAIYVDGI